MGVFETLKNNNFNVGLGLGYKITGKIEVDLGIGRTFWKDYTINALNAGTLPVKTTDKAYVLAIGIDFRL
jgi:long-subunit fatty acid transport protein